MKRRADLAQILRGGRRAFRAGHAEAGDVSLRVVQIMIAGPGERQRGEHLVAIGQIVEGDGVARGGDAALAGQHDALRASRRAGGEQDHRGVGAAPSLDARVHRRGDRRIGQFLAALGDDRVERAEPRIVVVVESARLLVEHALDLGQALQDRQHLVDLLLILSDDEPRAGEFEHAAELFGHSVGVERDGDRPQHLRGGDRPIELWPVGAGDGDAVAIADPEFEQALRERARLLVGLPPSPGAPDAIFLQAKRRALAAHPGVDAHEFAERVVGIRAFWRAPHAASPVWRPGEHQPDRALQTPTKVGRVGAAASRPPERRSRQ